MSAMRKDVGFAVVTSLSASAAAAASGEE